MLGGEVPGNSSAAVLGEASGSSRAADAHEYHSSAAAVEAGAGAAVGYETEGSLAADDSSVSVLSEERV